MDEKLSNAYLKYVESMETFNSKTTSLSEGILSVCSIDEITRQITIPNDYHIAGVMADNRTKRIYFEIPRYTQDIDLSTYDVFINYLNAKGEADKYICDDVSHDESGISFSWLIGDFAMKYKGDIKFSVCLIDKGNEHWNSTVATIKVLEGLETSEIIKNENPDIFAEMLKRIGNIESKVDINTITDDEIINLFQ